MTHFHSDLRLPVRTASSQMEDAIVQQVEWYMGRINLEKDEYLKKQMDAELWVPLDVILNFPKMKKMGVADKDLVAALLQTRSTVVEVDDKALRIRPAWARRSHLLIHDVPQTARMDEVAALFQIATNADSSHSSGSPQQSHQPGLISIQPLSESIWVAIFDSPNGASAAAPLVMDKSISGQKITPEVHFEQGLHPLPDPFRQEQSPSQTYQSSRTISGDAANTTQNPYTQIPIMSGAMMNGQMLNAMGMPLPVGIHPHAEIHAQYPYGPHPAAYMPHTFTPQSVGSHRQFIGGPRPVPQGYVMQYAQPGHPYDSTTPVPSQPHQPRVPSNQNLASAPLASQEAHGETQKPGSQNASEPKEDSSDQRLGINDGSIESADSGPHSLSENVELVSRDQQHGVNPTAGFTGAAQAHVSTLEHASVAVLAMPGREQKVRGPQNKPAGQSQYVSKTASVADPNSQPGVNRNGTRAYQGAVGRDRNQQRGSGEGHTRGPRGVSSSSSDGQSKGSTAGRKGKKGGRGGGGRHAHAQQDRTGDGRGADGKVEGAVSESKKDDERRSQDQSKSAPNLASMHFPPLPTDSGASRTIVNPGIANVSPDATAGITKVSPDVSDPTAEADIEADPGECASPKKHEDNIASISKTPIRKNTTPDVPNVEEIEKSPVASGENDASDATKANGENDLSGLDKTMQQPKRAPAQNDSPMSYAAILRSRKPPPRAQDRAPRPSHDSSKGIDGSKDKDISTNAVKERGNRRKKSNGGRSMSISDQTKDGASVISTSATATSHSSRMGSDEPDESLSVSKIAVSDETDSAKARVVENTRAHPVWVNKPKSLFQAAGVSPASRVSAPQSTTDSRRVTSPVSSQEEEKEAGAERVGKNLPNQAMGKSMLERANSIGVEKDVGKGLKGIGEETDTAVLDHSEVSSSSKARDGALREVPKVILTESHAGSQAAKGAWASGGPKQWPKANGTSVSEKSNAGSES